MKKQNLFIVLIVLCILTLAIGYSIFKTNVEVSGKMASGKNLDVIFTKIGNIEQVGSINASAFISTDSKRVTINVPNLLYKGAYVIIPISLKNVGTIPARLESISEYGIGYNSPVKVTYTGIGISNEILNPGDEQNFNVKVYWARSSINELNNNKYEFVIKFNYVQA